MQPPNHDPPPLDALLDAVDALLAPEVAATFRPPAEPAAIDRIGLESGVAVPPELRRLLAWHDGQAWNASLRPSDNRRLLSADEILDALAFLGSPDEDIQQLWVHGWIPFLTNDAGDYVVIDASPGGDGALIEYWHDWSARARVAASLSAWAAGLADELRRADD